MPHSISYQWADVAITAFCQDADQARQLAQLWQTFFCLEPQGTAQPGSAFTLDLQAAASPPPQSLQQLLWSTGTSKIWRTATGVCLQEAATYLLIDVAQGHATGRLAAAFWRQPLAEQRDFFLRSLLMLVRGHALYGLHANGVMHNDRGLLLVGQSGNGKTTLMLSLVQSGWRYLGDDVVALRWTAQGIAALAMQRGCACTPQTAAFFPNLPSALRQPLDPVRQKRQVALEATYQLQFTPATVPQVLLFPTITGEPSSRLQPLNETEAMVGLMEQSAGLLIEPHRAALQLAVLKQLVEQTSAYRLLLGRDVYSDPTAVATLLGAL